MSQTWTIVFVLGAPGAGKGTQCQKIRDQFGWQHLSTGDLLRAEVAAGSELGQEAQALMQAGEMVPTRLVLDLLVNAMSASGSTRFLVDGFPRKLDQLQEFDEKIQPADFVLVFTLPEDEAVARLVKRGETSGRADDNEQTIRSRMQVFAAESQPVIDALKETGRVAEIDSAGTVDEVYARVRQVIAKIEGIELAPQPTVAAPEPEVTPAPAPELPATASEEYVSQDEDASHPPPATTESAPAPAPVAPPVPKPVPAINATGEDGVKALPVRQYMDATVVPVLRDAMRALNESRPDDPLGFLAQQLLNARDKLSLS